MTTGPLRALFLGLLLLVSAPAFAQSFPPLSGRVVDQADLLQPEQEAALTQRLEALERASSRQLVVATVPDLQGHDIADYSNNLFRTWRLGQGEANNGVLLLVAVAERKVRIEVGYGLEGVLTDALSSQIIRNQITPRFRESDYPGGIMAGADAIIAQLQAPPEAAEQAAVAAQQEENSRDSREGGGSFVPLIFWGAILLFVFLPALGAGLFGRRYRGRRGVSIWGPGTRRRRGGGSGMGWFVAGMVLDGLMRGGRGGGGGSWGGGGGGSWGGGGFSGGGGSSGGGGASGGW